MPSQPQTPNPNPHEQRPELSTIHRSQTRPQDAAQLTQQRPELLRYRSEDPRRRQGRRDRNDRPCRQGPTIAGQMVIAERTSTGRWSPDRASRKRRFRRSRPNLDRGKTTGGLGADSRGRCNRASASGQKSDLLQSRKDVGRKPRRNEQFGVIRFVSPHCPRKLPNGR